MPDEYGLGRNIAAAARLDLQHYCFKDLLGYNISPEIPAALLFKNDVTIADIGTGTGIWLTDLSRELPHARLDGFDNSIDQCPPKRFWSRNVSFKYLDALVPVPEELHGKYDILNVRLFLCVIQSGNPISLLDNLRCMLKPGGYLQWIENDPSRVRVEPLSPYVKRSANDAVLASVKLPRKYDWVAQLPKHFQNAGFTSVVHSVHPIPLELQMRFTRINLLASEELSYVLYDNNGGAGSPGAKRRALLQEAFEETKNGMSSLVWSPIVVVGRKCVE